MNTKNIFYHLKKMLYKRKKINTRNTCDLKYKIINSYENYKKTGKLIIQSKRGGAYGYFTPAELCHDKKMINGFHPIDLSIIIILHREKRDKKIQIEINKPKYRLVRKNMGDRIATYEFEEIESGEILKINKKELSGHPGLLQCLSANECFTLGYDLGQDYSNQQHKIKEL